MIKSSKRNEAEHLRRQGYSINEISRIIGAAKSSVSLWVRHIELAADQKERLEQRRRQVGTDNRGSQRNAENYLKLRKQYQEIGRAKAREGNQLHLIGCMLYWAEGAKKRNTLYFANADPNMLLIFRRFLTEALLVTTEEMRIQIHCHATDTEKYARLSHTGLISSNFRLMPYTKHRSKQVVTTVTLIFQMVFVQSGYTIHD